MELERTTTDPTRPERLLAASFHLSWFVGLWPDLLCFILWWLGGRSRFVAAHAVQSWTFNAFIAPIVLLGVIADVALFAVASATGNSSTMDVGFLAFAAGAALWLLFLVLHSAAGAFAALKGRLWADPVSRVLARRLAARDGGGLPETERLLAASSYLSGPVALGTLLTSGKAARATRFHALQALLLGLGWFAMVAGLCFLAQAVATDERGQLEYGVVLPLVAAVPILLGSVSWAYWSFLGMFRAARGQRLRLPVVGAIAHRFFPPGTAIGSSEY